MVFGRHALDQRGRRLTCAGRHVELQQQPFELLLLLVEHVDEIVTREVIRQRIWPDAVVEYDQNINYAIRQVRLALGADASRVQTVPRRGYRFVGPLEAPRRHRSVGLVASLTAAFALIFGAGIITAHTEAGAFIYAHLVHPDRCPYIRMLVPGLRNS